MAKNLGTFKFPANFEVKAAEALDPRTVATSKEDLINKDNWPSDGDTIYAYNGLIVDCGKDGVYRLIDKDKILESDYSGWEKLNQSSIKILEIDSMELESNITVSKKVGITTEDGDICYVKYPIFDGETISSPTICITLEGTSLYKTCEDLINKGYINKDLTINESNVYYYNGSYYICRNQDLDPLIKTEGTEGTEGTEEIPVIIITDSVKEEINLDSETLYEGVGRVIYVRDKNEFYKESHYERIWYEKWPDKDLTYIKKEGKLYYSNTDKIHIYYNNDLVSLIDMFENSESKDDLKKLILKINNLELDILSDSEYIPNVQIDENGDLQEVDVKDYDGRLGCYIIKNIQFDRIIGKTSCYRPKDTTVVCVGIYSSETPSSESLLDCIKLTPDDPSTPMDGLSFNVPIESTCKSIVISEHEVLYGKSECFGYSKILEEINTLKEELEDIKPKILFLQEEIETIPNIVDITFEEINELRNNKELIPGREYRITDYAVWYPETTQLNVHEIHEQFPIIVKADTNDTLNQYARNEDCVMKFQLFENFKYLASENNSENNFNYISVGSISAFIEEINEVTYKEGSNWVEDYQEEAPSGDYMELVLKTSSEIRYYLYISKNDYTSLISGNYFDNNNFTIYYDGFRANKLIDTLVFYNYLNNNNLVPSRSFDRGMGNIYWMKDNYGNSAPWDFMNIKFLINNKLYNTFNNSFNNTINSKSLLEPVILVDSDNNDINISNSDFIYLKESNNNDVFIENSFEEKTVENVSNSFIKIKDNNYIHADKIKESLIFENYNQFKNSNIVLSNGNDIVIQELSETCDFVIDGKCNLDITIKDSNPNIIFSQNIKWVKDLELSTNTRYLITFDQKKYKNLSTDIIGSWISISI